MLDRLQLAAMRSADALAAIIPQPVPDIAGLRNCKIISHRGEHDNISIIENTLPAFKKASSAGVWGIECDIQWTRDLVPVISHDPCGARLFGNGAVLAELSFAELRLQIPLIPSLEELLAEFAGKTHLMIEIKQGGSSQSSQQKAILQQLLEPWSPGRDYHFLALDPALFSEVDFVAMKYCYPVSELNTASLSKVALELGCGGLAGHFYLISNRVHRRHAAAGQRVGSGFISSKNCLFRELNRGVEWIFSNEAVKIQGILDAYR